MDSLKKKPRWRIWVLLGLFLFLVAANLKFHLFPDEPPPPPPQEEFNERLLTEEAEKYMSKASELYNKACRLEDKEERDKLLDEAGDFCDKAVTNYDKIREYYEKNNLPVKPEHIWKWEKPFEESQKLKSYIDRESGGSSK